LSDDDLPGLEHYALKPSYGRLTGVAIGAHAIRDGYLLMHVGVGCKNKVTHLLTHDWQETCNLRQGWTEVGDRDLIVGATARVGPYLRSWAGRMDSGFVAVVSVTFLELAGEDIADEVKRIAAEMPMPVALIPALGFDGDEYDGYAAVCRAVIEEIPWSSVAAPNMRQVSLLGYLFDRYEGDHAGNLRQLTTLLKGIGLAMGPTVLGGTPMAELKKAAGSGVLIALPYLDPVTKKLRRFWKKQGRAPTRTDLPMGVAGTRQWLRDVGAAARVDQNRVEAYIRLRELRVAGPVQQLRSRWQGRRVAVFAEAPLAAGLCGTLIELGLRPVLVGTRGTSLGGPDAVVETLARWGQTLPEDAELLTDPSLSRIRERVGALLAAGGLDGVLGSSTELNILTTLQPTGDAQRGPWRLEIGFPCRDYHALMQLPFLGYGGVVTLAQRLLSAPRLWDDGRPPHQEQP
jgi:nitrogenase molybdenum-iron protein alpha/beta subunit